MSTATIPSSTSSSVVAPKSVVAVTRRAIDRVLIGFGALLTVVLAAAGGLLTWGHNFSADYVRSELASQHIAFPAKDALVTEGRNDLAKYGGATVDTGKEAEAYAKYINGHLAKVANGSTFADLGAPEQAANAELQAAITAKAPQAQIDTLKAKADAITGQRNTLFKGETLRGLLLTAFAWSTLGTIAGIAAIVSFVGAAVLAVLVILGFVHHSRTPRATLP
jgi:hypothetical protein